MAKEYRPSKGSLAYRPRKRASSEMPRVGSWPKVNDVRLLGFAGYKAGMTHVAYIEEGRSHLKGREVVIPVTIVETPPIYVYGLRFYRSGKIVCDLLTDNQAILKKIKFNKRAQQGKKVESPSDFDDVRALIFSQPDKTGIGKKTAERMEIAIGGTDPKKKMEYAQTLLGKEVSIKDVFKDGEFIDMISITIGKGWQGVIKRFGIPLYRPKYTGKRRHGGVIGSFKPGYVMWTIPRAGQMGYHKRTEYNKWLMAINQPDKKPVTPNGGLVNYGLVKNEYILVKGSVAGPKKRLIRMRKSVRMTDVVAQPKVTFISRESQQS